MHTQKDLDTHKPKGKWDIDTSLLTPKGSLWSNLGAWTPPSTILLSPRPSEYLDLFPPTTDYPQACKNLAHLIGHGAGLGPGMRILELACGYGASIEFWTKQFGITSVDVMDIRPECLSAIKERNPPGLGFCLTGSADDLELFLTPKGPLQPQNYDAVVCVDAAYHFSRLPAVFAAASKLLKPHGRLVWTSFIDTHGQRPVFLRRKLLSVASIPPRAILTQKELLNHLTEQNLSLETLVPLNSEVLGGFAKHVQRRSHEVHPGAKLSPAWWKISATGLAGAQLCKSGFLEYSLIGAVKVP